MASDPNEPFKVTIDGIKSEYKVGEDVNCTVVITNTDSCDYQLLKYDTPLEGFFSDMFQITVGGRTLKYVGNEAKRGDPTDKDWVLVKANCSLQPVTMTLSSVYEINTTGEHTVLLKTGFCFRSPETLRSEFNQEVESNVLQFTVREGSPETPKEEKDLCEKPTSNPDQSKEANGKASDANPQERQPSDPSQLKEAEGKTGDSSPQEEPGTDPNQSKEAQDKHRDGNPQERRPSDPNQLKEAVGKTRDSSPQEEPTDPNQSEENKDKTRDVNPQERQPPGPNHLKEVEDKTRDGNRQERQSSDLDQSEEVEDKTRDESKDGDPSNK